MSKTYRPWNPEQNWLLPPSPRDWVSEGDLTYSLLDLVQTLDLSPILGKYAAEGRGYPPFHPRMMVVPARRNCCTRTVAGCSVRVGSCRPGRSG